MTSAPLKIYFVLGEESGDALGYDLWGSLQEKALEIERPIEIVGLAGSKLTAAGMKSLFDIHDIAVMGVSAVIKRLPLIVKRVRQTVTDIERQRPDAIVLIDSPDFTHAVAKRVRKRLPDVPIINYVCPSVWAWRSGRAKKMTAYVDHVLAILPFEPKTLAELGGPEATYVGHPLARSVAALPKQPPRKKGDVPILLVLPGSRGGELDLMLEPFEKAVTILRQRGVQFRAVIPAVPKLKDRIAERTANWAMPPEIVDSADNDIWFSKATAALAVSGTVMLQLALHKVPTVSGYKFDRAAKPFLGMIKTWSSLLPNLILDRIVIPEELNEMVIPDRLARLVEPLLRDSLERKIQLEGFDEVIEAMKTKRPPGELAAAAILDQIESAR